jgi:membrane protein required for colicin V production
MQNIHIIDYGIFFIIALSMLMGVVRGFVREAMSLVTWVTAITVAVLYGETVAGWFNTISVAGVRLVLAFVLLVLATLIIGGLLNHLIGKVIKSTGFSITDRIIGILFGFARGVVVIALAIIIFKASGVSHDYLDKHSMLVPKLEPITLWLEEKLPEDLKKLFPDFKEDSSLKLPSKKPKTLDLEQ